MRGGVLNPSPISYKNNKARCSAAGFVDWEDLMAEHVMHKKESKKAPQKSLKEKREEKKSKKKGSTGTNP